ncbi:hypothetical protein GEMRC1_007357 [Eukaryota sp. GEM-RC1]
MQSLFLLLLLVTICLSKTLLIVSGVDDYSHITKAMIAGYDVLETDHFTDVAFYDYDLVILLSDSQSHTNADAVALKTFVTNGGYVMIWGNPRSVSFQNGLSDVYRYQDTDFRNINEPLQIFDTECRRIVTFLDSYLDLGVTGLKSYGVISEPSFRSCVRSSAGSPIVGSRFYHKGAFVIVSLTPHNVYSTSKSQQFLYHLISNVQHGTASDYEWKDRSNALLVFSLSDPETAVSFEPFIRDFTTDYDVTFTNDYTKIEFNYYNHVIIVMNGLGYTQASFKSLYKAVEGGLKLSLFGGSSNVQNYLRDSKLLLSYSKGSWETPDSNKLIIDRPNHKLAKNLPSDLSFSSPQLLRYSIYSVDPEAVVVIRNADGYAAQLAKTIGKGFLVVNTVLTPSEFSDDDSKKVSVLVDNVLSLKRSDVAVTPGDVLFIQTGSSKPNFCFPLEDVLREEGLKVDVLVTSWYSDIDVSPYKTIVLGLNGGFSTVDDVKTIRQWLDSGKRVLFFGGIASDAYISAFSSKLLRLKDSRRTWIKRPSSFLNVTDSSDPLVKDLPSSYLLQANACSSSIFDVSDTSARASLRREDGYGFPLVSSKRFGDGVFVFIDAVPGCWEIPDGHYFKQLIKNIITLQPEDCDFKRKSSVVYSVQSGYQSSSNEFRGIQRVLINLGIPFDLYADSKLITSDLSSYDDVYIFYNGGEFSKDNAEALVELLRLNKKIFLFWWLCCRVIHK